jgi:hypothetical protein
MKSNSRKLLKAGVVLCIAALFIGTSTAAMVEPTSTTTFTKIKAVTGISHSSRDQIELKYYDPNTLTNVVGISGTSPPFIWKSAIRLTQTELSTYKQWNITQVVIGFGEDGVEGPMNVKIIIYAKGTATHPGSIIVQDTTATLNGTALITVPLVTPVSLAPAGREEIWVAVEWTQYLNGTHYAFIDAGPAVVGKGDWVYLNSAWSQLHLVSTINANWAIGAIVEGQGLATIGLANIKGPIGIKADVQNTGDVDALNVAWSISVKGGILGKVNKTVTGTAATLAAHATLPISVPMFIGFGKINIVIKAQAANAVEVTATKSAKLLGLFVIGIK